MEEKTLEVFFISHLYYSLKITSRNSKFMAKGEKWEAIFNFHKFSRDWMVQDWTTQVYTQQQQQQQQSTASVIYPYKM